jgi:hypothetical protein
MMVGRIRERSAGEGSQMKQGVSKIKQGVSDIKQAV